jgi:glycosyltransferase involved in cell wall biosynthesis
MKKLAIIIPAYNEEKNIAKVVNNLNHHAFHDDVYVELVVVNDGSRDDTKRIVQNLNCTLIDLPSNIGIGGAVQTGFKYAYQNNFDWVMQVDGDGQHPASEISKFIDVAMHSNADVIIGSRFIEKHGFQSSFFRRLGIKHFKHLLRILCGITITDSTSGFRLLKEKALLIAVKYYPDEYPEPESIIYYSLNNLVIKEIAVEMNSRTSGKSSIGAISSIYYMFKVSLAMVFTFFKLKHLKSFNYG